MHSTRTLRVRLSWSFAAAVLTAALGLATGCETISADLQDMAGGLFPKTPGEAARMALDPHDPDNRREGTLLLSNAAWGGNPTYLKMYREYVIYEPDPLVKAVAIRALAKHGGPDDAPLIAEHLQHDNVQVRWEAAKGLQRLHNPEVVPNLLTVLGKADENTDVRVAAACALGQYQEDRVFQGLLAALDARDLAVNIAAMRSMEMLTGQSFGLDPRPWYSWYSSAAGDRFAGGAEYLYPTYHRRETWLEKLAFWRVRIVEQPAPPAGVQPRDERRTYEPATETLQGEEADG